MPAGEDARGPSEEVEFGDRGRPRPLLSTEIYFVLGFGAWILDMSSATSFGMFISLAHKAF